jgi:hypothetical protein
MQEDQQPRPDAATEHTSPPASSPGTPAPPAYDPDEALIGYIEKGQKPQSQSAEQSGQDPQQ